MEADQAELLDQTLRRLTRSHTGSALMEQLDSFGLPELLHESPAAAVRPLFHGMGESGASSAALHLVFAAALATEGCEAPADSLVVLPGFGSGVTVRLSGSTAVGDGFVIGGEPPAQLVAALSGQTGVVLARFNTADVRHVRLVRGLDPELGLWHLDLDGAQPEVLLSGADAERAWAAALAAGRRALAHQLVGVCEQMLALAVQHALDRRQFGRQIGSFQAVRHRLADAFVAKEAAAAAADLAWDADDEALAAMLAKSLAGRAGRTASTQCQQILAGIGFTAEHPFHLYLKRAALLDRLLGSANELPTVIGAHLLRLGALPRLVEL